MNANSNVLNSLADPEDFVGGILCIVRPINRDEFVRLCNSVKTSWWP